MIDNVGTSSKGSKGYSNGEKSYSYHSTGTVHITHDCNKYCRSDEGLEREKGRKLKVTQG